MNAASWGCLARGELVERRAGVPQVGSEGIHQMVDHRHEPEPAVMVGSSVPFRERS
jgi:hypothetical protein